MWSELTVPGVYRVGGEGRGNHGARGRGEKERTTSGRGVEKGRGLNFSACFPANYFWRCRFEGMRGYQRISGKIGRFTSGDIGGFANKWQRNYIARVNIYFHHRTAYYMFQFEISRERYPQLLEPFRINFSLFLTLLPTSRRDWLFPIDWYTWLSFRSCRHKKDCSICVKPLQETNPVSNTIGIGLKGVTVMRTPSLFSLLSFSRYHHFEEMKLLRKMCDTNWNAKIHRP